ncbi:hypothetical protein [Syntrophomonas palmitatica]|uniref:hypothetical protein n=1 Tax=Syntrophomonas palmitatica TaxID=402877 RepID=UPI0006D27E1F|nr:hypothetical protein [Syntrophomonas palmitatica]
MKRKWSKGDPVSLSDLLRITPVANEIMQLCEELEMSYTDVLWIVAQIIDNTENLDTQPLEEILGAEAAFEENWDDIEQDIGDEEIDSSSYQVNVQINGSSRFPEIGFKAGVNDKEDISYFFDMVLEMLDKLE